MTSVRRDAPLRAPHPETESPPSAPPPPPPPHLNDDVAVHDTEIRQHTDADRRAFRDAVRALRTGGSSLALSERTLMVAGGVVAPVGLFVVLLGWVGASRTSNLFEQIPYLISGGLFGLGLVFLGAFFYFAHWMTQLVKEQRASSAALLQAIDRLQSSVDQPLPLTESDPLPSANGHVALVATARGAMAHRPDCVVVVGKEGLRPLGADAELEPCKLCDPYAVDGPGV